MCKNTSKSTSDPQSNSKQNRKKTVDQAVGILKSQNTEKTKISGEFQLISASAYSLVLLAILRIIKGNKFLFPESPLLKRHGNGVEIF